MLSWLLFKNYLMSPRAGALVRTIARMCIVGVTLGVAALIIVISVMNGFNDSIREKLLAIEPHLIIEVPNGSDEVLAEFLRKKKSVRFHEFERQDVILKTIDGLFSGAVATGLRSEDLKFLFARVDAINQKKSSSTMPLGDVASKISAKEFIIGSDLARSINLLEGDQVLAIPPEVLLLPTGEASVFEKITAKALVTTQVSDVDSKFIFYNLGETFKSFRKVASLERGYEVYIENAEDIALLAGQVRRAFPQYKTETWIERNGSLFFALRMEKLAMTIFLSLTVLITSFSIITVLFLLLNQKRQDLGVLMSLGLSPKKTKKLFIRVGMILSGIGIGSGLFIGVVCSLLLEYYPLNVLPDIYYDSTIRARVDFFGIGLITLASLILAYLGAWLPVMYNLRFSPSEALRAQVD